MSETAQDTRATVNSLAVTAFAHHQLSTVREGLWKCARPATWMYGFFVAAMPGAIAVYGDTPDALLRVHSTPGATEAVQWLRGAIGSPGYLFEKLVQRQAYQTFYPDDALAWAEHHAAECPARAKRASFLADVADAHARGDLRQAQWVDLAHEHGIDDVYDVGTDWAASAWWMLHAVRTFIRLHDAQAAPAAAAVDEVPR